MCMTFCIWLLPSPLVCKMCMTFCIRLLPSRWDIVNLWRQLYIVFSEDALFSFCCFIVDKIYSGLTFSSIKSCTKRVYLSDNRIANEWPSIYIDGSWLWSSRTTCNFQPSCAFKCFAINSNGQLIFFVFAFLLLGIPLRSQQRNTLDLNPKVVVFDRLVTIT